MKRLWSAVVSLRTTALVLASLCALLLLNAILPQAGADPVAYSEAVRRGPAWRFLLVTLGLGAVATSPPFLAALGLFFLNLVAVLVDRMGTTIRRLRRRVPTGAQIDGMMTGAVEAAARGARPGAEARVETILSTLGYRALTVGDGVVWGVRHRWALLGFPLFHAAFLLLAAGGVALYLTRDVVNVLATEGQEVSSADGAVARRSPLGAPAPVSLTLEEVDVALEAGKPTSLSARLRFPQSDEAVIASVNRPVVRGDVTVLAARAGVAPVFSLVDRGGFTLDRVAVPAVPRGDLPTRFRFDGFDVEGVIDPVPVGVGFPVRAELPTAAVAVRWRSAGRDVFEGRMRPGQSTEVGGLSVELQEVRYWAGLVVVRERGGGVLVAGFLLSVVGIAWRMMWHRREIVVRLLDGKLRLGGRSERYPARFRAELAEVRDLVARELGGGEP